MSNAAMAWAWKQPLPMSSAKFVLVAMADQVTTDLAFMSVDWLATATGQDRKTVMANIARLIEWKLIEDTGERRGKTGQIPVYRLLMGAGLFDNAPHSRKSPKNGTGPKNGTVPKTDGNSTNFGAEQSQKRDTDLKLSSTDPSLSARVTACAVAMIEAGFIAARMNQSDPRLLRAAESCTPAQLAAIVREYATAHGGAPPNLAYVCITALNRLADAEALGNSNGNRTETHRRRPQSAIGRTIAGIRERRARDCDAEGSEPWD